MQTLLPTASQLILVLGGARSGKSTFAEQLAATFPRVTYLATAQAFDEEMRTRIAKHQADRPRNWHTVECPLDPATVLREKAGETDCFLLDCLTLLTSNLLLRNENETDEVILTYIAGLLSAAREAQATTVMVSNDVGLGLVPDNALGRRFRDLLGRVNQRVATHADAVYFLIAGLPINIKALACSPFSTAEERS
jgi:adenosylcobinamide kinase/adenosylcobinamide-phosphate guanylyltransferase